jgi:hypothetical protein
MELEGVDWIKMAQGSKKPGAVIKMVINIQFTKKMWEILKYNKYVIY